MQGDEQIVSTLPRNERMMTQVSNGLDEFKRSANAGPREAVS
jgi:hypothetical protein